VYSRLYGRIAEGVALEAVNWRVVVSGPTPTMDFRRPRTGNGSPRTALKGRRPVYYPQSDGYQLTPIYDRYRLRPGERVAGPAIVEERESTAVIGPAAVGTIDEFSSLRVTQAVS
jgi:N-methylhydantoinase A